MKTMNLNRSMISAACLGVLLASPTELLAQASAYVGEIDALRFNTGSSPARVSIGVGPHGSTCGNPNWFAFEQADRGLGALWSEALMTALAHGRTVRIQGNGTCDGWQVEGVELIDVQ